MSLMESLLARRSTGKLCEPAPSREHLDLILQAACTVPDHGTLKPYRFVVVSAGEREHFGEALADSVSYACGAETTEKALAKARAKAFLGPMQIAIIFSPKESKIARWEQQATAGCTGYAIALAADALGYGAIWKSMAPSPGPKLAELFALKEGEELLGWVNIGTKQDPGMAPRPAYDVACKAARLEGGALADY